MLLEPETSPVLLLTLPSELPEELVAPDPESPDVPEALLEPVLTPGLASTLVLGLSPELAPVLEPELDALSGLAEAPEALSGLMPTSLGLFDSAEDAEPDED